MERALTIKVSFQNAKGKKLTKKYRDWEARIFQHEYDHLDGVLYVDRIVPESKEKVRHMHVCVSEGEGGRVELICTDTHFLQIHMSQVQPVLDKLVKEFGPGGAL